MHFFTDDTPTHLIQTRPNLSTLSTPHTLTIFRKNFCDVISGRPPGRTRTPKLRARRRDGRIEVRDVILGPSRGASPNSGGGGTRTRDPDLKKHCPTFYLIRLPAEPQFRNLATSPVDTPPTLRGRGPHPSYPPTQALCTSLYY